MPIAMVRARLAKITLTRDGPAPWRFADHLAPRDLRHERSIPAPRCRIRVVPSRWERQAQNVTIIRDDWGIAHVYGKTDADAVFGLMYAQAEDDFNRIETNYLNSMGDWRRRRASRDLPGPPHEALHQSRLNQSAVRGEPRVVAATHERVGRRFELLPVQASRGEPRVITRFEPWMALTFSEGSIGGDIERITPRDLQALYGDGTATPVGTGDGAEPDPSGSNGIAIAPTNTVNHRALLLINPHTSFFFRAEVQV